MDSCAFTEGILRFTEELNENIIEFERTLEEICRVLSVIADDIRLGRGFVSINAPATPLEPEGVVKTKELYLSPDGYEEDGVRKEYITAEGGRINSCFMPRKGQKWSEEEKRIIAIIEKNCFMIFGRARVMSILQASLFTDSKTGAGNVQGLMNFGGRLMAMGVLSDYANIYINIKNFKFVNQLFGSEEGDKLLRNFSVEMKRFAASDGFFARLGGDNFILLIPKSRVAEFKTFSCALSFEMGKGGMRQVYDVRLRLGICEATEHDSMSDLMSKSTVAYGATKMKNTDVVYFTPMLMDDTIHRKRISTIFPKALENREFAVFYQPKVRLSDNMLCGCEALCRWIKDGTIVPPMEFIPVLESEGSICRLDFYVFERVCEDIKRWKDMGIEPVKVSVNFSKHHLNNKRLAEDVIGIIRKNNIDGKYLEIELTEMTGADDFTAMNAFISKMKEYHVSTSIDDFGTGYSSLNLLKDLDVDVIKLDKSFFSNITDENGEISTDKIVVKNIVNMVSELHMETISEGVETPAQADFLREINCNMVQGFLFDKPLTRDEFESRLLNGEFYKGKG